MKHALESQNTTVSQLASEKLTVAEDVLRAAESHLTTTLKGADRQTSQQRELACRILVDEHTTSQTQTALVKCGVSWHTLQDARQDRPRAERFQPRNSRCAIHPIACCAPSHSQRGRLWRMLTCASFGLSC